MPKGLAITDKLHLSDVHAWTAGVEADDATNKDEDSDDKSCDLYNEMDPNEIGENTRYDNQDVIKDNILTMIPMKTFLDEDSDDDDDEDSKDEEPDNNNDEKDDNDRSASRSGRISKPNKSYLSTS